MYKQSGSSARDIFIEVRDELIATHKLVKDEFSKTYKNHIQDFESIDNLEVFKEVIY
jgi:hypothetical protein